jgi:hypothetical protein
LTGGLALLLVALDSLVVFCSAHHFPQPDSVGSDSRVTSREAGGLVLLGVARTCRHGYVAAEYAVVVWFRGYGIRGATDLHVVLFGKKL